MTKQHTRRMKMSIQITATDNNGTTYTATRGSVLIIRNQFSKSNISLNNFAYNLKNEWKALSKNVKTKAQLIDFLNYHTDLVWK